MGALLPTSLGGLEGCLSKGSAGRAGGPCLWGGGGGGGAGGGGKGKSRPARESVKKHPRFGRRSVGERRVAGIFQKNLRLDVRDIPRAVQRGRR